LKHDPALQHIPVYIVSTIDRPEQGLKRGAQGVLGKPIQTSDRLEEFLLEVREWIDRDDRRVVVADREGDLAGELSHMFAGAEIQIDPRKNPDDLVKAIGEGPVDAVVVKPSASIEATAALIDKIVTQPNATGRTVILYVSPESNGDQLERWRSFAQEFELRFVESMPQLAGELVRAANVPTSDLAEPWQTKLRDPDGPFQVLAGKKVMIVDDDMRNIFALSSTLERKDIVTVSAETGRDAINLLHAAPDVDIVLMDIMMPEMDGIDTMRAIRQIAHFKGLPIIAVTAKAMKGDREKCIEAGAWDYLSKPVNPEQLMTVLRAWLTV
jgi:CheY-like chemotaxis protein